jgi:hypothetical protein
MRKVKRYIVVIVVLTMLPASYMTWRIIRQSIANNNLRKFVRTELAFKGTQILSNTIDENDKMLNILALGKTIPNSAIKQAASKLGSISWVAISSTSSRANSQTVCYEQTGDIEPRDERRGTEPEKH